VLSGMYLFCVIESYAAFANYKHFVAVTSQGTQGSSVVEKNRGIPYAQKAIRRDPDNADYYSALGSYLNQFAGAQPQLENTHQQDQREPAADFYLQEAIRRNPANPWYYYELGRWALNSSAAPQAPGNHPTAQYFQAALQNAPQNLFLRTQIGLWRYYYDQEGAFQLIREIVALDPRTTQTILEGLWQQIQSYPVLKKFLPDTPETAFEFSKFLYDKCLDAESDREAMREVLSENDTAGKCPVSIVSQTAQEIEYGNDDGTAEWRTYLSEENFRVKKVICLPENLADYHGAALKILMNSGLPGDFIATVSLNDHLLKRYAKREIPYVTAWYEIPFDKALLQGEAQITVYIRVTDASANGNYLQIMGDQDTPTTRSTFNFDMTKDLSYDQGAQCGEYMIRLVLKK